MAAGTCATYGGIHAMEGNPTGCMGLADYLGWKWKSNAGIPIVCVPGCPVQPDNFMETLLYLLHMAAGRAPMIPLDDALRPTWLFGQTVHEGCDRGGYYEQAEFAEEYGSRTCIVKLGCWGPVVQCNVGKRGWMAGIGGCPNVGGICIGCTMPGFPDKFMPFMNQPPGSLLSSSAVMTYGRAIHALRRFTQASLNKEPAWREHDAPHETRDEQLRLDLAEAEAVLTDLAGVFFQSPTRRRCNRAKGPAPNARGALSRPARPDSGRGVHGVSGSRASARPTSARRSRRRSASRNGNGWKIRCAGTGRFIPTTRSAGAWKRRRCFFPGSRCARRIA